MPVQCLLREYTHKYGISEFWWNIHPSKGCCAATLCIPVCGPCEDVFYLTIFQDSLQVVRLIRVRGFLSKTVVGRCRCLKNVFISGSILSGQTYVPSRKASTCGPSLNSPLSIYNQGLLSNGQATSIWWYLFKFCANINFSSGIFSVISSVLVSVCCWLTSMVPVFLNLTLMYFIRLTRVRSPSLIFILLICVAAETLPVSYRSSTRLLQYSMLRSPVWFFTALLPEYSDQTPV